jgi:hypothetical protein
MIPAPSAPENMAVKPRRRTLGPSGSQLHSLITAIYTALLCMFMYLFAHSGGKLWLNPCSTGFR